MFLGFNSKNKANLLRREPRIFRRGFACSPYLTPPCPLMARTLCTTEPAVKSPAAGARLPSSLTKSNSTRSPLIGRPSLFVTKTTVRVMVGSMKVIANTNFMHIRRVSAQRCGKGWHHALDHYPNHECCLTDKVGRQRDLQGCSRFRQA